VAEDGWLLSIFAAVVLASWLIRIAASVARTSHNVKNDCWSKGAGFDASFFEPRLLQPLEESRDHRKEGRRYD
jgi:hypothetical protein